MDTWIVLLLIGLLSLIGRGRRKSQQKPPRSPTPSRPPRGPWLERRPESRLPEPRRTESRRPRFEPPPTWEPEEPEEIEAWKEESEIPAAWLPDVEPPRTEPLPAPGESPQALLERLARAADVATRSRREGAAVQPGQAPVLAEDVEAAPPRQEPRRESPRLRQLRGRLASPQSLREMLLLKEILGPPRARRRGPFLT